MSSWIDNDRQWPPVTDEGSLSVILVTGYGNSMLYFHNQTLKTVGKHGQIVTLFTLAI